MEKPFTRSSEEADRLIALAKEKSLLLTCYQSKQSIETLQRTLTDHIRPTLGWRLQNFAAPRGKEGIRYNLRCYDAL